MNEVTILWTAEPDSKPQFIGTRSSLSPCSKFLDVIISYVLLSRSLSHSLFLDLTLLIEPIIHFHPTAHFHQTTHLFHPTSLFILNPCYLDTLFISSPIIANLAQ